MDFKVQRSNYQINREDAWKYWVVTAILLGKMRIKEESLTNSIIFCLMFTNDLGIAHGKPV